MLFRIAIARALLHVPHDANGVVYRAINREKRARIRKKSKKGESVAASDKEFKKVSEAETRKAKMHTAMSKISAVISRFNKKATTSSGISSKADIVFDDELRTKLKLQFDMGGDIRIKRSPNVRGPKKNMWHTIDAIPDKRRKESTHLSSRTSADSSIIAPVEDSDSSMSPDGKSSYDKVFEDKLPEDESSISTAEKTTKSEYSVAEETTETEQSFPNTLGKRKGRSMVSEEKVPSMERALRAFDSGNPELTATRREKNWKFWSIFSNAGNLTPSEETLTRREDLVDRALEAAETVPLDDEIRKSVETSAETLRLVSHQVFQRTRSAEIAAEKSEKEIEKEITGTRKAGTSTVSDFANGGQRHEFMYGARRDLLTPKDVESDTKKRMELVGSIMSTAPDNLRSVLELVRQVRTSAQVVKWSNFWRKVDGEQIVVHKKTVRKEKKVASHDSNEKQIFTSVTTVSDNSDSKITTAEEADSDGSDEYIKYRSGDKLVPMIDEQSDLEYLATPDSVMNIVKELEAEADKVRSDYMKLVMGFASAIVEEFR